MTYTVEHIDDYTDVVILDPTGSDNDLVVTICEDGEVWLRQQCPETDHVDLILITYSMLQDLNNSMNTPEGLVVS